MNKLNPRTELMDAILLEMAASHPYLSAEEEAAIKTRLFAIMTRPDGWVGDAERVARLFEEARAAR